MPTIEFLASRIGARKVVQVPDGGELVDICDDAFAPVPFSCRSAICGTCHVQVVDGAELLEEPNCDEQELLELLGGPEHSRIACQARVRKGHGLIRIRPLLAEPAVEPY